MYIGIGGGRSHGYLIYLVGKTKVSGIQGDGAQRVSLLRPAGRVGSIDIEYLVHIATLVKGNEPVARQVALGQRQHSLRGIGRAGRYALVEDCNRPQVGLRENGIARLAHIHYRIIDGATGGIGENDVLLVVARHGNDSRVLVFVYIGIEQKSRIAGNDAVHKLEASIVNVLTIGIKQQVAGFGFGGCGIAKAAEGGRFVNAVEADIQVGAVELHAVHRIAEKPIVIGV